MLWILYRFYMFEIFFKRSTERVEEKYYRL